jgi:hypothetical protein
MLPKRLTGRTFVGSRFEETLENRDPDCAQDSQPPIAMRPFDRIGPGLPGQFVETHATFDIESQFLLNLTFEVLFDNHFRIDHAALILRLVETSGRCSIESSKCSDGIRGRICPGVYREKPERHACNSSDAYAILHKGSPPVQARGRDKTRVLIHCSLFNCLIRACS